MPQLRQPSHKEREAIRKQFQITDTSTFRVMNRSADNIHIIDIFSAKEADIYY